MRNKATLKVQIPNQAIVFCTIVLALCLAFTAVGFGQVDQGTITGRVVDLSDAVIPNATVVLQDVNTGLTLSSVTDALGTYTFSPVKIGTYRVSVTAQGFQKLIQSGLILDVNQRLSSNLKMQVGSTNETIDVSSSSVPLLQTDQSSTGQVISAQVLDTTPLNGRNYVFVAQLTAGVDQSNGSRGQKNGDMIANGQRAEQNNYILDGIDNNSNVVDFLNGASYVVKPPLDALAEFKVQTGGYSAELGHSAGATINAVIKSGANAFHGNVWEYFRNDALNARNFNALKIPEYRQNQFGATIGGPIVKNRLFFFADAEATRIVFGQTATDSVPTPLMRKGDFSELSNKSLTGQSQPITLYQPNSGGTAPLQCNGRANVFCPAQINPVALHILNMFPLPNANNGATFNNYVVNYNTVDNTAQWDARLDWNASSHDQAFARFSYTNERGLTPGPLGPILDGGTYGTDGHFITLGESLALSETHIFTPTFSNEVRVGFTYGHFQYLQEPANTNVAAALGLGGIPFQPLNGGIPYTTVPGLTTFGTLFNYPANEHQQSLQVLDNVTKILGRHSLKAGFSVQSIRFSTLSPQYGRGSYTYSTTYTGQPGTGFTGYGVADYLADQMTSATVSTFWTADDVHWYRAGYVQDDFKLTPKLTINAGLRYEYFQPYFDRHDGQANMQPTSIGSGTGSGVYYLPSSRQSTYLAPIFTNALAANNVRIKYIDNRSLSVAQKLNFSPRVGFAYSASNNLVVRAGFGLFFGGLENTGGTGNLYSNYPFNFNLNFASPTCVKGNTCVADGITLANGFSTQLAAGFVNSVTLPNFSYVPYNAKTQYSLQYNLALQYALSPATTITVAYVGSGSRHLPTGPAWNDPYGIAAPGTNTQLFKPFPQFGSIFTVQYHGISNYNSAQVTLERRYTNGLHLLGTYTLAHSLDDAPTPLGATLDSGTYNNSAMPIESIYGNSVFDVRQRVTFTGRYDLPFGSGRRYLNNSKLADIVIGGWSLDTIFIAQTGNPFRVTSNIAAAAGGSARANLVRDPFAAGGSPSATNPGTSCAAQTRTKTTWFNPCAFDNPLPGSMVSQFPGITVGSGAGAIKVINDPSIIKQFLGYGRNNIYGPGYNRVTLAVLKNFFTFDKQYLQFRAETYNVLNTPAYGQPAGNVNTTGALITSFRSTGAYAPDARFFQLALKYYF